MPNNQSSPQEWESYVIFWDSECKTFSACWYRDAIWHEHIIKWHEICRVPLLISSSHIIKFVIRYELSFNLLLFQIIALVKNIILFLSFNWDKSVSFLRWTLLIVLHFCISCVPHSDVELFMWLLILMSELSNVWNIHNLIITHNWLPLQCLIQSTVARTWAWNRSSIAFTRFHRLR